MKVAKYKLMKKGNRLIVAAFMGFDKKGNSHYMAMQDAKNETEGNRIIKGYVMAEAAAKRELKQWDCKQGTE